MYSLDCSFCLTPLTRLQVMYFKSYSQYVSHYQVIVQILAQRKQDTVLQQIFESLKPQALGKGLKDYMIMPVQRIPRYALLLHVRFPSCGTSAVL